VLLRPLPFRDQDRLVVMWETDPASLVATTVVLAATGIGAAGLAPARALSIDPVDALRHD
jgi:hypothetical protein